MARTTNDFNIRLMKLVCISWHLVYDRRWAELNSAKVCSSSLLFFLISLFGTSKEQNTVGRNYSLLLHFSLQRFHRQNNQSRCWSRWENLDRFFSVNSVVYSPCETQPYHNQTFGTLPNTVSSSSLSQAEDMRQHQNSKKELTSQLTFSRIGRM